MFLFSILLASWQFYVPSRVWGGGRGQLWDHVGNTLYIFGFISTWFKKKRYIRVSLIYYLLYLYLLSKTYLFIYWTIYFICFVYLVYLVYLFIMGGCGRAFLCCIVFNVCIVFRYYFQTISNKHHIVATNQEMLKETSG